MTYLEWYKQQNTDRQDLSCKLMEISHRLGDANRHNDTEARMQLSQELKEIYEEISKRH